MTNKEEKTFWKDMFQTNGKWSYKRVTSFYVLNFAIVYAFLNLRFPNVDVKEFVFWGLLTYSGSMVGMILLQKNLEYKNKDKEDTNQNTDL